MRYEMVTKPIHKTTTKAKSLLSKLISQPNAPAIINISELLVLQGELDSALKRLVDVRDIYAGSYRYHLVTARANRDAGKYDLAKHHYEIACQLAPQNEVAIKELIELLSIPAGHPAEEMSAMAYGDGYDSDVATEQEETYYDDFSDRPSPWTSGFEHDVAVSEQGPETAGFAQTNPPPGLFLEDTPETTTPVQDTYASATNIFEPNIEGSNEIETTEDLFLPEGEEELDMERMQQEAFTDLFSSSPFNAEALQREAIRQIEAENGPISEDPFVDFETDVPGAQQPKGSAKPPVQAKSFSDLSSSSLFDESNDPPISRKDEPSNKIDLAGSDLFVGYDDDEADSPMPEASHTDIIDDEDLADFKIDRAKLASALTKLQSEPKKQDTESEESEPQEKPDFGTAQFKPTSGSIFSQDSSETSNPFGTDSILDDIDRLAADLSNLKFKPIEETNDPTPISEQRRPYSDEEEIKMPTKSLAQIFVSQGAYAKAIKVYESLIEHDPENATEYESQIEAIHQKMIGG